MRVKKDKILHIIAGALIALVALLLFKSSLIALALAAIAGAGKEWWDSKGHGTQDLMDFIATVVGGVLIVGGYLLWCRYLINLIGCFV